MSEMNEEVDDFNHLKPVPLESQPRLGKDESPEGLRDGCSEAVDSFDGVSLGGEGGDSDSLERVRD